MLLEYLTISVCKCPQINCAFRSPSFSPFSMIFCAMCRKYNSTIDALTVISYNADKAYSFYESGIKDCIFILSYMHLPVGQKASLLIFRKSMLYHFTLFHNSRQGLFRMLMDVNRCSDIRLTDGFRVFRRFLLAKEEPNEQHICKTETG